MGSVVVVVVAVEKRWTLNDFEPKRIDKNYITCNMMQPMRLPLLDISLATGKFIEPPHGAGSNCGRLSFA